MKCCYNCVPPKRHPACHDTCPDYIQEKAAIDAKKEVERKRREVDLAIREQRGRAVHRALRHRKTR